jgi:hypothetical protein
MRNDMKVKALRRKYKALGYATYIMMLELLTENDYFEIEWSEMNIELLTPDFDLDADELSEIIDYCVKLNLLQLTGNILHCDKLTERLEEDVLSRRKGYCINNSKRMKLLQQKPINNGVNVYNNYDNVNINQESKVKEIKVNKTELNKMKIDETEALLEEYYIEEYNKILEQEYADNSINDNSINHNMNIKLAKQTLDKLTEYIDDNNIPAAKKLLADIKDDYESFDNILQICYEEDEAVLNNWRNYFSNTLQFIN